MECVLKERLIPSVPVPMRVFIGCRLALARGKPWLAGKWENIARHISFEWRTKRDAMRVVLRDDHLRTFPIALSSPLAKTKAINRQISIGSSRSQKKAASGRKSTKTRCWRRCRISSRFYRASEVKARDRDVRGGRSFADYVVPAAQRGKDIAAHSDRRLARSVTTVASPGESAEPRSQIDRRVA
jgi:hypothetical protein